MDRTGFEVVQLRHVFLPCCGILALHPVHDFIGTPHVTLVLLALRQPTEQIPERDMVFVGKRAEFVARPPGRS
jgi:hypothetical protein